MVVRRVTDTVNARDRCHDDGVAALQQRLGGRQPHLLDVFIDRGILFDKQIPLGHIGLRLVVVVVRNEILDRVIRKEGPHLSVKLGRKGLIGRKHQSGAPESGDDIGHGESLARARNPQQSLEGHTVLDALHQTCDCLRLIAGGLKGKRELEGASGETNHPGVFTDTHARLFG